MCTTEGTFPLPLLVPACTRLARRRATIVSAITKKAFNMINVVAAISRHLLPASSISTSLLGGNITNNCMLSTATVLVP